MKLRTYSDVRLMGVTNNKIYINDNQTLEAAQIGKEEMIHYQSM